MRPRIAVLLVAWLVVVAPLGAQPTDEVDPKLRGSEPASPSKSSTSSYDELDEKVRPNAFPATTAVEPELPQVSPEESVEAGREALNEGWWGSIYPWYDTEADDVRAVRIQTTRQTNMNWSWPNWLNPVVWAFLAFVLVLLGWFLYRAWRKPSPKVRQGQRALSEEEQAALAARLEALPFPVRRGDLNLLDEAARLYELGNYSEAIIYLFSFQLTELDKHHVLQLTKGKTNRQYLREVERGGNAPRRTMRGLLEQTMVAFEDVFFGRHDIDRRRFENCWNRLDEFRSLLQTGGAA